MATLAANVAKFAPVKVMHQTPSNATTTTETHIDCRGGRTRKPLRPWRYRPSNASGAKPPSWGVTLMALCLGHLVISGRSGSKGCFVISKVDEFRPITSSHKVAILFGGCRPSLSFSFPHQPATAWTTSPEANTVAAPAAATAAAAAASSGSAWGWGWACLHRCADRTRPSPLLAKRSEWGECRTCPDRSVPSWRRRLSTTRIVSRTTTTTTMTMRPFSLDNDGDDRGARLGGRGGPTHTDTDNGDDDDGVSSFEPGEANLASSPTDGPGRGRANVGATACPNAGGAVAAGAVRPGGDDEMKPPPPPPSPGPGGGGPARADEDRKAEGVRRQRRQRPRRPAKSYCSTVCMVPPAATSATLGDASREAWAALTRARTELKDPGLYRWPPHVNSLYPFAEYKNAEETAREVRDAGIEGGGGAREVVEEEADGRWLALFKEDEYSRRDGGGENRDAGKGGQPGNSTDEKLEHGGADAAATAAAPPPSTQTATEDDHRPTVLSRLAIAAQKCEPFRVHLDELGCFGGAKRGVLWVYPSSTPIMDGAAKEGISDDIYKEDSCGENRGGRKGDESSSRPGDEVDEEPLIRLQKVLQDTFPSYNDQRKGGKFTPHVTLSHFETLFDAEEARERVERWWTPVSFDVREIYVLKRVGDDGQFLIAAAVALGGGDDDDDDDNNDRIRVFHPPVPFEGMPAVEEVWVREERMKLKERRNRRQPRGRWRGRRRRRRNHADSCNEAEGGNGRGISRSTDTPEEIAAKRAARKAKRELLERAAQNQQEDRTQ